MLAHQGVLASSWNEQVGLSRDGRITAMYQAEPFDRSPRYRTSRSHRRDFKRTAARLLGCGFLNLCVASASSAQTLQELGCRMPRLRERLLATTMVDLDNDGSLDVIASEYGGVVRVLRNNGAGEFSAIGAVNLQGMGASRLLAADLDGDFFADLFVVGAGSTVNSVWRNDQQGGFSPHPAPLLRAGERFTGGALGDVDRDGDTDVLLVGWGGIYLLLNAGDGSFVDAPPGAVPQSAVGASCCALFDRDGDGDLDIYIGTTPIGAPPYMPGSGIDVLLDNDGTGSFTDVSTLLPFAQMMTSAVAPADFDGDADIDLFVAVRGGNPGTGNYLLAKQGALYQLVWSSTVIQESTIGAVAADVDGDGDFDVLIGRDSALPPASGGPGLLLNDGQGNLFPASPDIYNDDLWLGHIDAGDLDRDGDVDIVCSSPVSERAELFFNRGDGRFVSASCALPSPVVASGAAIDLDGNAFPDVIFGTQRVFLVRDAGLGAFEPEEISAVSPEVHRVERCLPVDLDGDGDDDVVLLRHRGTNKLQLLWNDAGNPSPRAPRLPSLGTADRPTDAGFADLDGDGDLDLVVGFLSRSSNLDSRLLVWENVGSAQWNAARPRVPFVGFYGPPSPPNPQRQTEHVRRVVLFDCDDDGDTDILVGMWDAPSRLLLNLGQMQFVDAPTNAIPALASESVAEAKAVDLDDDGDADLVIARGRYDGGVQFPQVSVVLENRGGIFVPVALPAWPPAVATDVEVIDIDGDGRLDLLFGFNYGANGSGPGLRLLRNLGAMSFVEATGLVGDHRGAEQLVVGDFDRDGDPDLMHFGLSSTGLLSNVTRQLSTHAPARPGYPVELRLHGPPFSPWLLYASASGGSFDLGALGWLFLDPRTSFFIGGSALDGAGRGTVGRFVIPNTPASVGTSAWIQGSMSSPVQMTNPLYFRLERY
ncbi:MAG: VCBS repeat-containing protein [Planctomycetes bacterium]|nr:VCBS repeat-containing protein [Planctomycetota bacterium]